MSEPVIGQADLGAVHRLLHEVFPESDKFATDAFLRWFYAENPDGSAAWRDALVGTESRAHYGAIPQWYHSRAGRMLLYLSVNSATHASLRRKGMFTRLGEAVYADIRSGEPAAAGVVGVPNWDAHEPRVKRLGWQIMGPLPVLVSLGAVFGRTSARHAEAGEALSGSSPLIDDGMLLPSQGWRQRWTLAKLAWRVRNPLQRYWVHRLDDVAALVTTTKVGGIPVALVAKTFRTPCGDTKSLSSLVSDIRRVHRTPVVAYVGFHRGLRLPGFDLPLRLRPSPLYLGWRLFDTEGPRPELSIDCFEALDFDVF